ncbi:MAG: hypothetical protein QW677_11060 [Pyrobaculum sp.]|uniref:hypothetical protein n=1 Tax=Pyrobaculum sp. TaxID=2004705 RepID=UPI003163AF47
MRLSAGGGATPHKPQTDLFVALPESLLEEALKRGVDVVDLLSKSLGVDPPRRASP